MKRISSLVIAILIGASVTGQVLTLSSDTTSVSGYVRLTDIIAHATIQNNSAGTVDVHWVRFVEEIPSEWEGTAVCDGNGCYLMPVGASPIPFSIEPGVSEILDVHFYPNEMAGDGTVRLRAWMTGDSANTVVVGTYKATAEESVGVTTPQESEKIRIYPNPAKEYILIKNLPEGEVSTVEVYNIFGRRMLSFSQSASSIDTVQKFDVSTLAKGIYMIRVFDADMNVIYTESLSKE